MHIQDLLLKYRLPLFAPEDEQGGGEAPAADQAEPGTDRTEDTPQAQFGGLLGNRDQAPDDSTEDGEDADSEAEADPDRPEHIPAKFWKDGKLDEEGLAKAYAELEKSHGKLKRDKSGTGDDVPEAAAEYFKDGLELGADVKNLTIEGPDDPGLKAWGEVCHKYGLGKELATNLARDMFGIMDGYTEAPIDPDAEMAKLGRNAKAQLESVFTFFDGAHKSGKLSDADVGVMNSIAGTADGIKFLANVRAMSTNEPIPVTDASTGRHMTQASWDRQFKAAVKAQDYEEQERLEEVAKDLFGTHDARSAPPGKIDY